MQNLPQRTCIGCNIKKDKKELIRIVKNKDGTITVDKSGKESGRGAYLCDNIECLEKALKNKKLEKSFQMKIEKKVFEELRGVIIDK